MDPITNPHTKTSEIEPQPINSSLFFTTTITYKECLKNHAATLGAHALDGCCEFFPSPTPSSAHPSSLKCAACGCHRNFHRLSHQPSIPTTTTTTAHFLDFHHPPSMLSPPPLSTSRVLLRTATQPPMSIRRVKRYSSGGKRFRTKFSEEQKEKMLELAKRIDWKMRRCDDEMVDDFCNEIGIDRNVVKVWMHNNKTILRNNNINTTITTITSTSTSGCGGLIFDNNNNTTSSPHQNHSAAAAHCHLSNNASSSSS